MTTNNLAEAARAEAERRWPMDALPVRLLSAAERKDRRIGFEVGARWARDRFAQEPPEAEVEAAAIALYNEDESWGFVVQFAYGEQAVEWEDLGDGPQEMFREFARRALRAARATRRDEEKR